jgi:hypothetical protein
MIFIVLLEKQVEMSLYGSKCLSIVDDNFNARCPFALSGTWPNRCEMPTHENVDRIIVKCDGCGRNKNWMRRRVQHQTSCSYRGKRQHVGSRPLPACMPIGQRSA